MKYRLIKIKNEWLMKGEKMKAIAMFNNKGGVGKTTLTCNLSAYIARTGKKVMLIDADPQCNSTIYCFTDDLFSKVYYDKKGFTIYDVIKPVNQGIGYVKNVEVYNLEKFGFDFLAGDPKLALFEDTLASDWSAALSGGERGIRTTLTFNNLIKQFDDYDYVFFDMGPSLGAINRSILLSCDYFVTPMSSDIFSILAIENIGKTIKNWRDTFKEGFNRCTDTELKNIFEPISYIQFLGYVTQQYTSKTVDGIRRPVQAYERILSEVPMTIKRELIDIVNEKNKGNEINYELGTIPNFNSIIPLSQSAHRPAFELTSTDGIVGAHFAKVKDFKVVMDKITNQMVINLEKM